MSSYLMSEDLKTSLSGVDVLSDLLSIKVIIDSSSLHTLIRLFNMASSSTNQQANQPNKIIKNFKPLIVTDDYIIGTRGYSIYRYDIKHGHLHKDAIIKDKKNAILSRWFLSRRLFRAEATHLIDLKDNSQLLVAKKGIFKKESNTKQFHKVFHIPRGSRPMNLCMDKMTGVVYFGEYFLNFEKKAVHIYASKDLGETWDIVYTFAIGKINHIHGVFYDKYTSKLWVVTGDRENECIIGYSSDNFKTFVEVFRGGQEFRTCNLMFYQNHIIYVMDSQYMQNEIKMIDRATLKITSVHAINGSGIYAGQHQDMVFCSSTIEPSTINTEKYSCLYISYNQGKDWQEIARYKKDIWNKSLFQFGSIQFPNYVGSKKNVLIYSGRALNKIGGHTVITKLL